MGCEDQVELFGGGCVGGLDGVDIDLACGGRIGVAEAGGYGSQWDTGVDHQRGVGMAQAVDGDVRQVVRSYEITEPTKGGTPKSPAFWGKEKSRSGGGVIRRDCSDQAKRTSTR